MKFAIIVLAATTAAIRVRKSETKKSDEILLSDYIQGALNSHWKCESVDESKVLCTSDKSGEQKVFLPKFGSEFYQPQPIAAEAEISGSENEQQVAAENLA